MSITAPISTIDHSKSREQAWSGQGLIDRIAARTGSALIKWTEARAAHAGLSHDENRRARQVEEQNLFRQLEAQRLTQRIGY